MTGVTYQAGTVSAVDADRVQARIRLLGCDNLRTSWLNVLQHNTQDSKGYWLLDVGEQIGVLLDVDGEDGVILGTVYLDVDEPPFSDRNIRGTRLTDGAGYSYSQKTYTLIIRGGIEHIVIECGADVVLKMQKVTIDALGTRLIGDLYVRGELIYEGDMAGPGGGDVTTTIRGNIEIKGNAHVTGSMLSDGESSSYYSY